jgi:uncharacterized membrane protein
LIIGLGIAITSKSNSYEEEDYALADTLVVDSMAVDTTVFVSESKTVSFKNNSNLTVYLAYAFWNNTTWESVGWYEIAPNQSYEISLPESFSENSIYWYAEDSEGAKYESNDGYFCVDHEEPFHFYKNKDCGTQEGFYKLNLTGTYTEQGLR